MQHMLKVIKYVLVNCIDLTWSLEHFCLFVFIYTDYGFFFAVSCLFLSFFIFFNRRCGCSLTAIIILLCSCCVLGVIS